MMNNYNILYYVLRNSELYPSQYVIFNVIFNVILIKYIQRAVFIFFINTFNYLLYLNK